MSSKRFGKSQRLYISTGLMTNADGTGATWVEFTIAEKAGGGLSRDKISFKTRANGGQEISCSGALSGSTNFDWVYDPTDATQASIIDAVVNGANLAIATADGDIATTGTKAKWGNYTMETVDWDEPIDGGVSYSASGSLADEFFDMAVTIA